ncbi:MAG: MarR family transcriptional regulator [Oscillospiraceae bacterium]|nr:MarR family transcriptional regulator [Oscillospiraceae bacterium]
MKTGYEALDLNNKLIWNLRDIGYTMRRIREGRGSQRRVLILLRESGPTTQRELTARLGIQPGSASEVIGKLETAGLLVRAPSRTDRRTADIRLTAAGEAAAAEAQAQRETRHRQMFDCLTDAEKDALLSLLERVNACWDTRYRENDAGEPETASGKGRI